MDKHMQQLAVTHVETKFIKVSAGPMCIKSIHQHSWMHRAVLSQYNDRSLRMLSGNSAANVSDQCVVCCVTCC